MTCTRSACRCGRVHRAAAPAGTSAAGTVTYGLSLQAWCIYLMAAHHIPVHRCAELIADLTGAKPHPWPVAALGQPCAGQSGMAPLPGVVAQ